MRTHYCYNLVVPGRDTPILYRIQVITAKLNTCIECFIYCEGGGCGVVTISETPGFNAASPADTHDAFLTISESSGKKVVCREEGS